MIKGPLDKTFSKFSLTAVNQKPLLGEFKTEGTYIEFDSGAIGSCAAEHSSRPTGRSRFAKEVVVQTAAVPFSVIFWGHILTTICESLTFFTHLNAHQFFP